MSEQVILEDGRKANRLRNGTLQDAETGHFITGPADDAEVAGKITPDNARKLNQARWDAYRTAAETGAVRGAKSAGHLAVLTAVDAYERIISAQTELAMDKDRGRDSTGAAKFVRDALDAAPDRRQGAPQELPAGSLGVIMDAETAKYLVDAVLQARNGADVADKDSYQNHDEAG